MHRGGDAFGLPEQLGIVIVYDTGGEVSAREEAATVTDSCDSGAGISDFTGDAAGVWESCEGWAVFAGAGEEDADWTEGGCPSMETTSNRLVSEKQRR